MFSYEYVTEEQLAGFDKYKYSAVDTNPLSVYVMHPFWNSVVKILPTWLAPNLLTFCGFILLVLNFCMLAYFDYDFYASACTESLDCDCTRCSQLKPLYAWKIMGKNKVPGTCKAEACEGYEHVPSWVWVVAGLLNFTAYTLDGVDGKQARRTNSSTPLGELFDHGLDSWACIFFVVTVYSIFGRGEAGVSVLTLFLILWVVLFSFILSHWEKYNTGILFLPWGYDLSQVTISIVYIITAVVGVEAWYGPIFLNFQYRDLFTTMILSCAFIITFPVSLYNVFKAYRSGTLKQHSFYEAMLPFISPVLLFGLCMLWVRTSPYDILEKHPRVLYFLVGTAFSNITCKLIVCQMSNTRCQPLSCLLLPLAIGVIFVISGILQDKEYYLLIILTIVITLAHIHYGVCVVNQLSKHFNIYAFSLKKPNTE